MKYTVLGLISLLFSVACSVFIFLSATGTAGSTSATFQPVEVESAGIGFIIGLLLTIFFFYKHYRGHPEMHLFDQDAT
jgi:hypothetical protein